MKHKCLVCGELTSNWYKFKYGSVWLCYRTSCKRMFSLNIEGSLPVVWVGDEDIESHDLLSKELLKKIPAKIKAAVYGDGSEYWWNDDVTGLVFGDFLKIVAQELEYQYILHTPRRKLPLLITSIKFPDNEEVLKECMKGIKHEPEFQS